MRRLLFVLLVLNALLLPLSCLPLLLLVNVFGMGVAFIADFSVENRTDEPIYVTPIGSVGPEAKRTQLPMIAFRRAYVFLPRSGLFRVEPGEKRVFYYDMDDVNFSEIVVENEAGRRGQIVVNPQPARRRYHAPAVRDFTVRDIAELDPVDPRVHTAYESALEPNRRYDVAAAGCFVLLSFVVLTFLYRRTAPKPDARLTA